MTEPRRDRQPIDTGRDLQRARGGAFRDVLTMAALFVGVVLISTSRRTA